MRPILALALGLVACSSTTVNVAGTSVPADAKPAMATTTAPSNIMLGRPAATPPTAPTPAPATIPPPPAMITIVQTVNVTVLNVTQANAWVSDRDCAGYQLSEDQGYCTGETGLVLCKAGRVQLFDCSTEMDAACGYLEDGGGATVDCLTRDGNVLAPSVAADSMYAFTTSTPCSEAQEMSASCDGSFAAFCQDGLLRALDCASYRSPNGDPATCGLNEAMQVDCRFPK
jgi:hypothetical protein